MGDLKTTAEERARLREWRHGDASDARAWRVAEDACHDVDTLLAERESLRSTMGGLIACNDTLLAENAKLRAVRLAARARCRDAVPEWAPELRAALAALEAP